MSFFLLSHVFSGFYLFFGFCLLVHNTIHLDNAGIHRYSAFLFGNGIGNGMHLIARWRRTYFRWSPTANNASAPPRTNARVLLLFVSNRVTS